MDLSRIYENVAERVSALKNFAKKKDDEEKKEEEPIVDKAIKVFEAQEDYKPTEEQIAIGKTDDTGETESIQEVLRKEEKEKEQKEEKNLDDTLADIEKVLSVFSDEKPLATGTSPFSKSSSNLNKPVDFTQYAAKQYVAPYLQQPTSQGDRVELLYQSLKKQNLI